MSKDVWLPMLLAAASCNALADWTTIGSSNDEFTMYADASTKRVAGNMVKMWILIDYKAAKTANTMAYMSSMTQREFDCQEERVRTIYQALHRGAMRSGDVVHSFTVPSDWIPIAPGTFSDAQMKLACKKS